MLGLMVAAVLAGPLDAAQLEVVGFSDDGKSFAAVMIPAGASEGWLRVVNVANVAVKTSLGAKVPVKDGKAQLTPKHLEAYPDRGTEKFTKGTKLRTEVDLGGPLTIQIVPGEADDAGAAEEQVVIGRGPWCNVKRTIPHAAKDPTLVSVLASRDGKAVAVVLKRTVQGTRVYDFTTARVKDALPWCSAGTKPATDAQTKACLAAAVQLPAFDSVSTTTDHEGGATLPRYEFTHEGDVFSLGENPSVGEQFVGKVAACWQIENSFTFRITDTGPNALGTFDLQLVRTTATEATLATTSPQVDEVFEDANFVARPKAKKRK